VSRAAALTLCSWPAGCPNLTQRGLCPKHRAITKRAYDRRRPGARERGYDAHWEATRSTYLAEHPVCEAEGCDALSTDVDHLDGRGPLGPAGHDPSNLRALCHPCHSARTARDQPGGWNR
jgi:5-methylcytosine-specific restriction protein A